MRSPLRTKSPNKSNKKQEKHSAMSPKKIINQKLHNKRYFCHYSNCVYMGGIDCFKKEGKGILFMDNGACAITEYTHDVMIGHNVIFRDKSLTSILVNLDRTKSICFRTGPYLLYVNLGRENKIVGEGVFIHYIHRKIFKLKFLDGELVVKQRLVNLQILRKVFDENNLKDFIEKEHVDALNVNLKICEQIKCAGLNDRHVIGFCDEKAHRKSFIAKGLCFKVFVNKFPTEFDVVLQERGYIENNLTNVFGQRHFDNGNYYVGEFNKGKFEGKGVLMYPKEMKWTYGEYRNGQLKQVLESSVESKLGCEDILFELHKSAKPFLQTKVQLNPSQKFVRTILKEIDEKDPLEHGSMEYANEQQKKEINLKTIQTDYTVNCYGKKTEQILKELLSQRKEKKENVDIGQLTERVSIKKCLSEHKFSKRNETDRGERRSSLKKNRKQSKEQIEKQINPQLNPLTRSRYNLYSPHQFTELNLPSRGIYNLIGNRLADQNRVFSPIFSPNFSDLLSEREKYLVSEARCIELAEDLLQTAQLEQALALRNIEKNRKLYFNYLDEKNYETLIRRRPYLLRNDPIY